MLLLTLLFLVPGICCSTSSEAAGAADQIEVTGEVGGSVAINCPTIPNKAIVYFYFQKKVERIEDKFVNGFYTGHANERPPKPNSRLDAEKNTTVHLFNLTMVDDGAYECLLEYTDGRKDTNVYVHVTANYSQPKVTGDKLSDSMYMMRCESRGGYPKSEPRCNASKPGVLHDLKTNVEQDQDGRFSINSTAYVNCSQGVVSITCMVKDKKSNMVTLCQDDGKLPTWVIALVVSTLAVALVGAGVAVYFLRNRGKRNGARTNSSVTYTPGHNGKPTG